MDPIFTYQLGKLRHDEMIAWAEKQNRWLRTHRCREARAPRRWLAAIRLRRPHKPIAERAECYG
ncbi:MAG: hypothetical protein GXY36_10020 [Chloroflexi bacterium]|nr:hypothetical protein [Chloroflexota bacterium]